MNELTNATKAQIITAVNSALVLALAFGIDVSDVQQAAIMGAVNAVLSAYVAATYRQSPKRIDDA